MNVFFSHVQSEMRQMRWTSVIRRLDEIYDRLQQSMFLLVEGCCWNIHVIFVSNILMKEDLLCTRMFVSSPCNCMFVWNHLSAVWSVMTRICWSETYLTWTKSHMLESAGTKRFGDLSLLHFNRLIFSLLFLFHFCHLESHFTFSLSTYKCVF